jgi:hypothetical protein
VATAEGLRQFDADGSPITVGPVKFTSKGQVEKNYQTPLRRRHRLSACLPEFPGRPDVLSARPRRPDRRQFHAPLRQGHLPQVRRVQFSPCSGGPRGESRPVCFSLPDPRRCRCSGGGSDGQGRGLELCSAEV